MMERWAVIKGHEEYSVSDLGRIRRDTEARGAVVGRILTPKRTRKGYRRVELSRDDVKTARLIHQLVAVAFLSPRPSVHHFPNHIDANKANNAATNLEWLTRAENTAHAKRLGLMSRLRGERNGRAKLTARQVEEIRALQGEIGQREIARQYGVSRTLVQRIHQGRRWQCAMLGGAQRP